MASGSPASIASRQSARSRAESAWRGRELLQCAPEQPPADTLITDHDLVEAEVVRDSFENRRTREDYVGASWLEPWQFLALCQRQSAGFRNRGHHAVMREMMPMHDLRIVSSESKSGRANGRNRPRDTDHRIGDELPPEPLQFRVHGE